MRLILAALLVLATALPSLADLNQTSQWPRVPRDARMAYMTGAAAALRVFALSQPGTPMPDTIRVDQAVTNLDHLASDPMYARKPIEETAYQALIHAQDKGTRFVEKGPVTRDAQFDYKVLFDRPWLYPINLDGFVPTQAPGPKPTFAHSWFATAQHQRDFFLEGFGDMVDRQCLTLYGNTPSGQKCARPLLPLPTAVVLMEMDRIYRDPQYADQPYDAVIRAALLKMSGDDWQAALKHK